MPSAQGQSYGIPAVAAFQGLLSELLQQARVVKPVTTIEPSLKKSDFENLQARLSKVFAESAEGEDDGGDFKKTRRFAIIETAARDTLSHLIVS